MRKRSAWKRLVWIVIILGAIVAGYLYYRQSSLKDTKASDFQTINATRGEIHLTILTTGVVTPKNRLDIKPPIAGRVDDILVNEGDAVTSGQVLAYMSSSERAALLDAARARGKDAILEWEKLLKPTPILAPISGTIIKRNVVPGQTFGIGEAVYTMSDRLIVNAQVDETDIGKVSIGQATILTLDAYPTVNVEGTVSKIAFDARTVNNVTTYDVEVTPAQIPPEMRSGMTANVNFDVERKSNALLIPQGAIKVKEGKSFVLVPAVKKEDPPEERPIETGLSDGKNIEVVKGLSEGDSLLIPAFSLQGDLKNNPFSPVRR